MRLSTKRKISSCVDEYRKNFDDEFKRFVAQQKEIRKDIAGQFAEVKGKLSVKRLLFNIPETLHNIIVNKLDVGELTEFSRIESALWFARKYPEFTNSDKI
jgi:hypothetical protein